MLDNNNHGCSADGKNCGSGMALTLQDQGLRRLVYNTE